jgi:hypothetical protein
MDYFVDFVAILTARREQPPFRRMTHLARDIQPAGMAGDFRLVRIGSFCPGREIGGRSTANSPDFGHLAGSVRCNKRNNTP